MELRAGGRRRVGGNGDLGEPRGGRGRRVGCSVLRIVRSRPYGPCLVSKAYSVHRAASDAALKAGKPCKLPLLTSLPSWPSWPSGSSSTWLAIVLFAHHHHHHHHHQQPPSTSSITSPSSPSWLSLPSSSLLHRPSWLSLPSSLSLLSSPSSPSSPSSQ